jgi:hypothetical protein
MKKINVYDNHSKIDKAWFDSSNILYAECKDNDNEFKTVKVVFKNGSQYVYYDVNVNDWIKFREASSQGKALNAYITQKDSNTKKPIYEFRRLEDADVNLINEEYNEIIKEKEYTLGKESLQQTLFDIIYDIMKFDTDKTIVETISQTITEKLNNIAKEHNNRIQLSFK